MQFSEYKDYATAIARRFVRYRRSGMIDENDLLSTAMTRLWEIQLQKGELDEKTAKRVIRLAMLDVVRSSSIVRTPRNLSMHQAIQAYQQINNIGFSEEPRFYPVDEWVNQEPVRQVSLIVDGLPYDDRLLLSLVWEQGCSLQDAADVLEVSKATVNRRYQAIINKIKSQVLQQNRKAIR
jgi:RNA polymerase sigma factor FliA